MRYLAAEAQSAEELQQKVQGYITAGWEPLGGIAVATHGALNYWYYQAMIMRSGQ